MDRHMSIFINSHNIDTDIVVPETTRAMADRPFWVIFDEVRDSLLRGDRSLDDNLPTSHDDMTTTDEYKRSSWPRLDAMVHLCSQLWHKSRDIVVRSNHRQSRLWCIPGALLLVYIGGYVFLNSPQLTSDAVPWYIAPSYPSTFAPTIRSTARAAPPPRMAERVLFGIHLAPLLLLWLIEACRHRGDGKIMNTKTHNTHKINYLLGSITRYPVIFLMMMPAFGIATAVSLYSAIHYLESPNLLAAPPTGFDRKARSALAAVVLGIVTRLGVNDFPNSATGNARTAHGSIFIDVITYFIPNG